MAWRFSTPLAVPLVLLLASCSAGGNPAGTTGSAAAPRETPASFTWEQVDPDPGTLEGPVAVVGWKGGLLGVGSGRTWASPDGVTWTAGTETLADRWGLADLVALDGRAIAAGQRESTATVWTTTDGATWTAPDDPDLVAVPPYERTEIGRLVAGPGGILAVGVEYGAAGQRPAAWWSEDGDDWARSTESLTGSRLSDAATDGATWVGVGAATVPANDFTKAAFWTSPDGRSWTETPDDGSRMRTEPAAVAWTGEGFVAVGLAATFDTGGPALRPQAWVSRNGSGWSVMAASEDASIWPFPGPTPVANEQAIWGGSMTDLVPIPGGLLAVGTYWGLDPAIANEDGMHTAFGSRGVTWTSTDGTAWTLGPEPLFTARATPGDQEGAIRYTLLRVTMVDGRPIVTGIVPGAGSVVWTGAPAP